METKVRNLSFQDNFNSQQEGCSGFLENQPYVSRVLLVFCKFHVLVRKAEKSIWDGLAAKGRGTWGDTHLGMQTVILSHCMACQLLVKWKIWWHKGLATYTKWLLWFFYILKCEDTKLRKLS